MDNNIKSTYEYLIYLLQCGITDIYPSEIEKKEINLKEIFALAVSHHVENIMYVPMSKINGFDESNPGKIMREIHMHAVFREAKQEVEAVRVMDAFEKAGIKYMPLKGFIIKNLYPSPDFRQSTDFDIYVPAEYNMQANKIMTGLGYVCDSETVGRGMHDEYRLGGFIVEIHKKLMAPEFPKWCRLCEELLRHITLAEGYQYRYEFSKEDYYLYMQLHTIKHLKFSSSGIKSILDIWIYLKKYKNSLDWEYINKMLEKGGLVRIDANLRELSDYWFENITPEHDIIYSLADYIAGNGAFGTHEQYINGRCTDESKLRRILRAFFSPYDDMAVKYPIVKRIPFLLPFAWIYRAVSAVFCKKTTVSYIIDGDQTVDENKARKLSDFKKEIGL